MTRQPTSDERVTRFVTEVVATCSLCGGPVRRNESRALFDGETEPTTPIDRRTGEREFQEPSTPRLIHLTCDGVWS